MAHYAYHDLLEGDDDITASESWYAVVEKAYIEGVTAARSWLKSRETSEQDTSSVKVTGDTSVLGDELVNLLTIPKVELDKFDGDPLMYQSFVSTFNELVDKKTDDAQIKLTRLLQYTTGPAKESIKYCAIVGGQDGYSQARSILSTRFGNKYLVSQKVISNLKQSKTMSKGHEFQQLADDLQAGLATLEKLDMVREIDTQQNMLEIVHRFPDFVQNKWKKRALQHKRDKGYYPSIADFVKFVSQIASDSCDPVYGGDMGKTVSSSSKGASYNCVTNPMTSTFATANDSPSPNVNTDMSGPSGVRPCVVCQQSHKLFYCDEFKGMRPEARLNVVKQNRLCFNCLQGGHSAHECFKKSVCSVPGCGKKHTKFIHVDMNVKSGNDLASHQNSVEEITNASANGVCSNVQLPMLSVKVNGECDVYALLDSGSTNSFITEELASQLNLSGHSGDFYMRTLSQNSSLKVKIVSVNLGSEQAERPVSLDNVLVIPNIPAMPPSMRLTPISIRI